MMSVVSMTKKLGVGFGLVLASWVCTGLGASPIALAAPSLILLEDNGDANPIYRKVIENLGAIIVANNLGHIYDHVDVLTGNLANRDALFAQIRKRGSRSAVDVVILTHGADKSLALSLGDITDRDIRAAGPLPRLRMVYMMACYGASLEGAWRDAGAQVVVGHQDVNSLSGFFFPRFLRRWSEGASAREAADDAYRFSQSTANLLSTFIQNDENYLSSVGVERSEPILQGVDMDRFGHLYPDHVMMVSPLPPAAPPVPNPAIATPTYAHTDFERMGISVLSTMIPQASLNVDAIPSAQQLVNRVHAVAWDQLLDSFPSGGSRLGGATALHTSRALRDHSGELASASSALTRSAAPADFGLGDLDLPTEDGQQIWIDGEAIGFLLGSAREYAGDKIGPVLDHVQGLRLTRQGNLLNAAMYFDTAFDIALQAEAQAPNLQPYAVHVPKTVRFSLQMLDGILTLRGLDQGSDALNIKLKIPALPDTVWLRMASVDLSNGNAHVEAGVLSNVVTVIANAEIAARKFDGIDVWETVRRNLNLFEFPILNFRIR